MNLRFRCLLLLFPIGLALFGVGGVSWVAARPAWSRADALTACLPAGAYAPGVVLAGYRPGVDVPARQAAEAAAGVQASAPLPGLAVRRLRIPAGQECAALETLRRDARLAFAELDAVAHSLATASPPAITATGVVTPNDPYFRQQWAVQKIRLPQAWAYTTGVSSTLIAVVDSGVQLDHPELAGKLWTNPGEVPANGLDDDGNGIVDDVHGARFFQFSNGHEWLAGQDGRVQDDYGHGTHVAGIAAAQGDNGAGMAGVSWQARLLPVKVLDEYGQGFYSDIARGIVYAAAQGARVINLSLGGVPDSQTLRAAVDYARSRGALVVAASGNEAAPVLYPAAYGPVLAVAATDGADRRAVFSNYGPQVDLAAPGTSIFSTWNHSNYYTKTGTSMAAPQVSGAAALLWARHPELSADQVAAELVASAKDVEAPSVDELTGAGRLDVYRALAWLEPTPDLWVEVQGPVTVTAGMPLTYTLRYGNHGGGATTSAWLTATATTGGAAWPVRSWTLGALPAHSGPFTATWPVMAPAPGLVVTTCVQIAAGEADVDWIDNAGQAVTRVEGLYHTFLALIPKLGGISR